MITSIFFGFAIGLAVSMLNHQLLIRSLKKKYANKSKKKYMASPFFRYILNFVTLFIVHKDPAMLIAAAIGLTMVKNYILLQHIIGKKGVS